MKEKKVVVIDEIHSRLLSSPHIVNKLIDLLVGELHPTPSKQKRLITHLIECPDCRIAFSVLLAIRDEYETKEEYPERFIHDFLVQFRMITDQIESRKFEQLGAYAEKIVAEGRAKADEQFPIIAKYIRRCSSCQSVLEDMLDFLRKTEKIDQRT